MTKLHNFYPEDITCVLCFPCVFQTTEEFILGPSEDCLCCQFLVWKRQVDLTVKQSSAFRVNLFQLLYSTVGRLEELKVKPLAE